MYTGNYALRNMTNIDLGMLFDYSRGQGEILMKTGKYQMMIFWSVTESGLGHLELYIEVNGMVR